MYIDQLLVEGYCNGICGHAKNPCKHKKKMGIYCFECQYFSYAECPNAIAYSSKEGLIESEEDWIGFGGEMFPNNCDEVKCINAWHKICRKKISEAYDEYMNFLKQTATNLKR